MCAWSIPVPSTINPTRPTSSKKFSSMFATFLEAIINLCKTSSGIFKTSLPKCCFGMTHENPFVFGSMASQAINSSSSQNNPAVLIFPEEISQKIHLLSFVVASYFAIIIFPKSYHREQNQLDILVCLTKYHSVLLHHIVPC